jgi:nitrous oxidase accessory protein NosD
MMKLLCIAGMLGMASAFSLNATEVGTHDTTHDEKFEAIQDAIIQKSHITRRLAVINVVEGPDTVQSALASAAPGDELVLGDGTYLLSSTITIDKDITIRAMNSRQAILDGGNSIQVMTISSGTVVLEGVIITRGYSTDVSPHAL